MTDTVETILKEPVSEEVVEVKKPKKKEKVPSMIKVSNHSRKFSKTIVIPTGSGEPRSWHIPSKGVKTLRGLSQSEFESLKEEAKEKSLELHFES